MSGHFGVRQAPSLQMKIADPDNLRCLSAAVKSIHHEEAPRNRPKDLSIYEVARDLWKATWDEMWSKRLMAAMFESLSRGARLPKEAKWPIQFFLANCHLRRLNVELDWEGEGTGEVVLQVQFLSLSYPSPSALICVAEKDRAFRLINETEEDLFKIADLVANNLVTLNTQREIIEEGIGRQT